MWCVLDGIPLFLLCFFLGFTLLHIHVEGVYLRYFVVERFVVVVVVVVVNLVCVLYQWYSLLRT